MKYMKHILLFITIFTFFVSSHDSVKAAGADDFVITIKTDNAGFSGDTEYYFPGDIPTLLTGGILRLMLV